MTLIVYNEKLDLVSMLFAVDLDVYFEFLLILLKMMQFQQVVQHAHDQDVDHQWHYII